MEHTDPFDWFADWYAEARASEPNDANAMALATATPTGRPSVRIVLLKAWDRRGFVFYTNLDSRKGRELAANPAVHADFHWKSRLRQIRMGGDAELVPDAEADAYFAGRPRTSQLGAWASDQSRPMPDRAAFETRLADATARFEGGDVPRPRHSTRSSPAAPPRSAPLSRVRWRKAGASPPRQGVERRAGATMPRVRPAAIDLNSPLASNSPADIGSPIHFDSPAQLSSSLSPRSRCGSPRKCGPLPSCSACWRGGSRRCGG